MTIPIEGTLELAEHSIGKDNPTYIEIEKIIGELRGFDERVGVSAFFSAYNNTTQTVEKISIHMICDPQFAEQLCGKDIAMKVCKRLGIKEIRLDQQSGACVASYSPIISFVFHNWTY